MQSNNSEKSSSAVLTQEKPKKSLAAKLGHVKAASSFKLSSINQAIKKKQKENIEKEQSKEANTENDSSSIQDGEQVLVSSIPFSELELKWRTLKQIFLEKKQPSLSNAVDQSKIEVRDNTVVITVVGEIAKQMMMEQYSFLVNHIKQTTGANRFSLELQAIKLNIQAPKTFTKQEQLAYIMKENPAIERLCKEFSLEIDYNG